MGNKEIFERIINDLGDTDDVFAEEFAEEFTDRVRRRTPVDTGTLQNGWDVSVNGNSIDIWNDVPYAGYVEDGTEHMSGAHMLKTTLSEVDEIAKDVVRKNK